MVMMPQRNSSRYDDDEDKLTAQFTPGQLIIGICVSLFVLLAAFLLGVLVGKYDRSLKETATPAADTVIAGGQGVQVSPRVPEPVSLPPAPDRATADQPPDTPVVDLPPLPATPDVDETQPAEEPPPAPPAAAPDESDVSVEPPPQDVAAPTAAAAPSPPPPALVPLEPPPEEPPAAEEPAAVAEAAPPPPPTPPPAPVQAATEAVPTGYGVQVVSLTGDRRIEGAASCQSKLKAQGWESVILQYNEGQSYAVVVVGFADRAAALAARDALRQQKEFKDCFVKTLP